MTLAISVLTQDQVSILHEESLNVLSTVGVRVDHTPALELLAKSGAQVDRSSRVVRLSPRLLEQARSAAPSAFTFAGLTDADGVHLAPGEASHGRPGIGIDMLLDHRTGVRRPANTHDLEDWTRLVESLRSTDLAAPIYPQDQPPEVRDLRAVETTLRYSRKPLVMCAYAAESVEWMARMVEALPGGPVARVGLVLSADSPLSFSENQISIALAAASHGFPVLLNSAALLGATSPVTLWGALVQMHAEVLAELAIVQTAHPGTPVIYDAQPLVFDMRVAMASFGYAELGLLNAAFVQLARSQGLLTESAGFKTDALACDEQAGREKILTVYLSALAGADVLSGMGSLAVSSTVSLAQMVIDDDVMCQLSHLAQGIRPERLGGESAAAIAEVGPLGHYLDNNHTVSHFRQEFAFSSTAWRGSYEGAPHHSSESVRAAAARVESILRQPQGEVIDDDTSRELTRIMQRAANRPPHSAEARA